MNMRQKYERLASPFQIKGIKLKNRMVKAPFSSGTASEEGYVTRQGVNCYEMIAAGGVGLSIVEGTAIEPKGVSGSPRLVIYDDKYIEGFSQIAAAVHKHDCPIFLQLNHAGPAHSTGAYGGQTARKVAAVEPVAASTLTAAELPTPLPNLPRGLTIPEIKETTENFVKGAQRAIQAGFDGVEIHFAHGYLVHSFLSRAWNKRQDEYGGSLENRVRFAREIVEAIRQSVSDSFVVGARLTGREYGAQNGLTIAETQEIARVLERAGIDYFSITGWGYGHFKWLMFPEQMLYPEPDEEVAPFARYAKKGAFTDASEAVKKVTSVPVMTVGSLRPDTGERVLRRGQADLIAFCRVLIADPELPKKVISGRTQDIVPCTRCLTCFDEFMKGNEERCRINPGYGKEPIETVVPVKKKKVMVVGAGPAGMEAAIVAAERGHDVTLYDSVHQLGGVLNIAALIKGTEVEDLPALVRYMGLQLAKLGVKVELGKVVTPALVEELKPDTCVIAAGGKPPTPDIPGINRSNVLTSAELHRRVKPFMRIFGPGLLNRLTRFWLPIGKKVVIVGGLIHGCEVAEFLVKRGRKVTVTESSGELGTGIPDVNRVRLLDWLERKGVTMWSGVTHQEITDRGLVILDKQGERKEIEADTVLVALPPGRNDDLLQMVRGMVPETYSIGDCEEPRLIVDAIEDGWRIGNTI